MKKIVVLCACVVLSIVSKGQNVMVIENKDHTATKLLVDKIQRVYFEEVEFKFDKGEVYLLISSQIQLNLINNTGNSVNYNSSNHSVASVNNAGLVKALSKGTATITAKTDDGLQCQCEVVVKDITDFVSAKSIGGSITSMNNLIQYGSSLNWRFTNNSTDSITLRTMQLIDGETGTEGNQMNVDVEVSGGSSVSYSTRIGLLGIHAPVTCRFRYEYKGVEYSTDAVYENKWL